MKRDQLCKGMKVIYTHPAAPGKTAEAEVMHIPPGREVWIRIYMIDGKQIPGREIKVSPARLKCYSWYKEVLPSNRLKQRVTTVKNVVADKSRETGLNDYQLDHLRRLKEEERLLTAAIEILVKNKL